ncbi:alpha/beta fold hydrolase [Lactiplantibacillus garii]|uniref:Alpha/beta fold hydrolase n=1 Tax=Lactiplantibacillus garii TaxID=2306423 RepID=A0A3R8KK69_9LACO|nr:alpha/beta fold hydrolase [Lactiplantibacillus garii]RRK09656.1 alpha/beta fold hydrolase [Lactiplantibacillus garii]
MSVQLIEVQRDGLTIRGTLTIPDGATTYPLAILMHGFTSDRGNTPDQLLYQLSAQLVARQVATLRFDFNGHGASDGRFQDMTVVNEIADAEAILTYVRQLPDVQRIYLLGHSQGGVVASMLAGLYPEMIAKVVLMAPAATLKSDAQKGVLQGATYDPHRIPDALPLTFKPQLSVGGAYLRSAQVLPIYEVAQRYRGPVALFHGDQDTVVSPSASRKYEAVYEQATLHVVPGADHGFQNGRERVVAAVVRELTESAKD